MIGGNISELEYRSIEITNLKNRKKKLFLCLFPHLVNIFSFPYSYTRQNKNLFRLVRLKGTNSPYGKEITRYVKSKNSDLPLSLEFHLSIQKSELTQAAASI